ncbi:MAG: glycosyltransferase [Firmicutes bacterium]|nr:glycosyltransferase [Bacillota bacterium]MCL5040101.1 glycosyltransferase [Bacillota bacterium]
MTGPQLLYIGSLAFYFFIFGLFLRLFLWKGYADRVYWKTRPRLGLEQLLHQSQAQGGDLPFLSVLVPARNEAEVIDKTMEHLAGLEYPKDRYEVLIITDEKEDLANQAQKIRLVQEAREFLDGKRPHPDQQALVLGVAVLIRLAFRRITASRQLARRLLGQGREAFLARAVEGRAFADQGGSHIVPFQFGVQEGRGERGDWGDDGTAANLCPEIRPEDLFPKIEAVVLRLTLDRRPPERAVRDTEAMAPGEDVLWAVALPVAVITRELLKRSEGKKPLAGNKALSEAVLGHLSRTIALGTTRDLRSRRRLRTLLEEVYHEKFPVTADLVRRKVRQWEGNWERPALRHVVVPFDFDGNFGGRLTGQAVPSTKGRALNYAIPLADPRSEMLGFYDAESRPDRKTLLYVAWRRLAGGRQVKILQGPVFQVRNFHRMGPLSKMAALYQSISHEWYLPVLFRSLPFVGGTNLFIERDFLHEVEGFDYNALTEDLEFGVRAYVTREVWPEYLPYVSTEQTPTSYGAFYRQRLRWGAGYLQTMEKVWQHRDWPARLRERMLENLLIKGPVQWLFFQVAVVLSAVFWVLARTGLMDPSPAPGLLRGTMVFLTTFSVLFTLYAHYRYRGFLDRGLAAGGLLGTLGSLSYLAVLPFAAFFLPAPYTGAVLLRAVNRLPKTWIKTPRTRE